MSLMKISHPDVGEFSLKVLSFNAPMQGQIQSSQAKSALHHYPIKANQQKLVMEVVFSSTKEYMDFQTFIRKSHRHAIGNVQTPELNLWWPERGIEGWTGVVLSLQGGDERFNPVPRTQMEILLVDSMLSQKTFGASIAEDFGKFFDTDIGNVKDILGEGYDTFLPPKIATTQPAKGQAPNVFDTLLGNLRR